jgi:hypothetical protein
MIKLDKKTKEQLIELQKEKNITIEGNILRLIDSEDDEEFQTYIDDAINKDKENRRKRLDITKRVQIQNNDLIKWKEVNEKIQEELKSSLIETEESKNEAIRAREDAEFSKEEALLLKEEALLLKEEAEKAKEEAENAKKAAENDLEILQRKTQFELMERIVKVALWIILGIGVVVTGVFIFSMISSNQSVHESQNLIGNTWTNIIGILLTNCFSIVGTIMGVKYASTKKE